jgi:hypothetical protein
MRKPVKEPATSPTSAMTAAPPQTPTYLTDRMPTMPAIDITAAMERSSPPLMMVKACPTDITNSGAS